MKSCLIQAKITSLIFISSYGVVFVLPDRKYVVLKQKRTDITAGIFSTMEHLCRRKYLEELMFSMTCCTNEAYSKKY